MLNALAASRGAGNNGPVSTAQASSFLNAAGTIGRVTISERIEGGPAGAPGPGPGFPCRVAAGADRAGTDVGAGLGPGRGISIRTLATAAGLSPSRVHQIVAARSQMTANSPRGTFSQAELTG